MRQRIRFLTRYLASPNVVGAVAPSSLALAKALCEPYLSKGNGNWDGRRPFPSRDGELNQARSTVSGVRPPPPEGMGHPSPPPPEGAGHPPSTILEVGAGTGAVTRYLGSVLRSTDRLDICELDPAFVETLEREVLSSPIFAPAVNEGRVRLIHGPVQQIEEEDRYDFVISGLPLTAFALAEVKEVFSVVKRCLKPGGVFSYFEYVGLRMLTRTLTLGKKRSRIAEVSRYLTSNIRRHQFKRKTVLMNVPPAHARHWRFETASS